MSQKKIIVGNWKMNPESPEEASKIFSGVKKFCWAKNSNIKIILCPPSIYLTLAQKFSRLVGAQDVSVHIKGAHTGEINAKMLSENDIDYVIVGHSERRAMGETDEVVNKKINNAFNAGLKVILCVGELERDSEGEYLKFIKEQIRNSLRRINRKFLKNLIVAYEPVFEIGRKDFQAMSPHDIHQIVIFIRKHLVEYFGDGAAIRVPIIYGGSASADNSREIFKKGAVDGFLIGRQSLDPEKFGAIIRATR